MDVDGDGDGDGDGMGADELRFDIEAAGSSRRTCRDRG